MPSVPESSNRPLESFREYLRLLARMNMDPRLQARIDPSDLAQQTLLKAHEKQGQFRGKTDAERAAWLRTILANQMTSPKTASWCSRSLLSWTIAPGRVFQYLG